MQERKELFTSLNRSIDNVPPMSAALTQHVLRATYQAGHCWGQSLVDVVDLPSPANWGWMRTNEQWLPVWSLLPEASMVCRELLRCGCKRQFSTVCKCVKANLACISLCFCGGGCRPEVKQWLPRHHVVSGVVLYIVIIVSKFVLCSTKGIFLSHGAFYSAFWFCFFRLLHCMSPFYHFYSRLQSPWFPAMAWWVCCKFVRLFRSEIRVLFGHFVWTWAILWCYCGVLL